VAASGKGNELVGRLYESVALPWLTDMLMRLPVITHYRRRVVPEAQGDVLEIGIGSGHNLRFYAPGVRVLHGIDPSWPLLSRALRRVAHTRLQVDLRQAQGEGLPFESASMDCVVSTFTLCSVGCPDRALQEIRRVLRPGGRLLFAEHGLAPEPNVQQWQRRWRTAWRALAGGCTLDRPIAALVAEAGFEMTRIDRQYARGPRVLSYMYVGEATKS
jgi:ubiquinone/menaquinone biosynthesis C-methylase UbiE